MLGLRETGSRSQGYTVGAAQAPKEEATGPGAQRGSEGEMTCCVWAKGVRTG